MLNVEQTLISQYGNSTAIKALINSMNDCIDPTVDLDNFYNYIWNIETAQGFGLDIWGRIVGVSRKLEVADTTAYLGFNEGQTAANDYNTFGYGIFYSGPKTGSYYLSDDAYRVLIYLKSLSNISDSTIPTYNKLLQFMFAGRGRAYVIDNLDMSLRGVFEFYLLPYELAILSNSGAVPRPAGVGASILQVDKANTFGFSEAQDYQPFGYGTFGGTLITII